jgi:hypothetical protein
VLSRVTERANQIDICSDTNWHTMLYLIRSAFSIASASSESYYGKLEPTLQPPTLEGQHLLQETREVFRKLMQDSPKARVERGFLLGLLEMTREYRVRGWEEGKLASTVPLIAIGSLPYFDPNSRSSSGPVVGLL